VKVIKPLKLGLLTRCLEFKGSYRMGASVLMHVPLTGPKDLFSEVSLWKLATEQLGADAAIDAGVPKLSAEFLVAARAFAPNREAVQACSVRVNFAGCEKTLHVCGDREWLSKSKPSDPKPFVEMPLDWSKAFGGVGFADNPAGKGATPIKSSDGEFFPLPNVTYPEHHVYSQGSPSLPAGFGPIDQVWPQRARRAGTYDDIWFKRDYPGYAADIDWNFFNLAPQDQWLTLPLPADAAFAFDNMHQKHPRLQGQLPGFAARCFINQRSGGALKFKELTMQLGTVWFFPHLERAILIYQGYCNIAEEDAADIEHVVIAADHVAQPRAAAHFYDVLARRLDKETGFMEALKDSDLVPADLPTGMDADLEADHVMFSGEGLLRANLNRKHLREVLAARAEVASHGLDPDAHGPPLPEPEDPAPDLEHLPQAIERLMAKAKAQREAAELSRDETMAATAKEFAARGMDFAYVQAEIDHKPFGPPSFKAQEQVDSLRALAQSGSHNNETLQVELRSYSEDPAWFARLNKAQSEMNNAYRKFAHWQGTAPRKDSTASERARQFLQAARQGSQPDARELFNVDLTGTDLTGMDLTGIDLSGAFLESADLSDCNLEGCKLVGTVLTRACLHRTNFANADLSGANLGGVDCFETRFDDANLTDAILDAAKLTRTRLRGALLQNASLLNATFENVDMSAVRAERLLFMELILHSVRLSNAVLPSAAFIKCDLRGVDFSHSVLSGAVFVAARGAKARFRQAKLDNLRCVEACDFSGADFSDAMLAQSNFRATRLDSACFDRCDLSACDFSEAQAEAARFYMSQAQDSRFVKTNLTGALLVSANLMNCCLQRACLFGADLRFANLHQADLARVRVDNKTSFQQALLTRARTQPRWSPAPEDVKK